jgi:hypothetical protein
MANIRDKMLNVRVSGKVLKQLDTWRKELSRSEAVRRLIAKALAGGKK